VAQFAQQSTKWLEPVLDKMLPLLIRHEGGSL